MSNKPFTVLIAGGGIAGLTLANMLEKIGVDYLILEGYREMAPQVGASIGILPNGSRVLDQIGLYDDIRKLIDAPLFESSLRCPEGPLVTRYLGVGTQINRRQVGIHHASVQIADISTGMAMIPSSWTAK